MDELLGARVPHSPQAEQAVIGSMLIDPGCIPEVLQSLRPAHFYIQSNQEIFETILDMFNFGLAIDPVTVLDHMTKRGVIHENSRQYVSELMQQTPTSANVSEYVDIVLDKSLQRDLGAAAQQITDMVNEGLGSAEAMLEMAEQIIYKLRNDRSVGGLKPVSEIIQEVYAQLTIISEQGSRLPGVSTGLVDLDKQILGLNEGELVLIASRPGMGKTSIALNIALAAARASKKTVVIFSLEMSREQLVMRLMSGECLVPVQKMMRGDLTAEEWRRLVAAASALSQTSILMDDNPMLSVADMNAQCRRVKNLGLVVIDYLQLMQSSGNRNASRSDNRQQVVADMSRMLKIMAKDLSVPVLCLSQLSRASETRTDKRPVLSDLRESGAIEQDADVVIGLYREGYYNKECENPNAAEAIILKNRKGETGTVPLLWMGEYTSYASVDHVHSEEDYAPF